MGVSTDAILMFGFDLGGYDEMSEEQQERFDHFDEDGAHEVFAAEKKHGVELQRHCSDEAPYYMVGVHKKLAWRGYPQKFDVLPSVSDADTARIKAFCEDLGLVLPDDGPSWILASDWG